LPPNRPENRLTKSGKNALIEARSGGPFLRGTIQPQAKPEKMRTLVARGRRTYRRVARCKHRFAMRSASLVTPLPGWPGNVVSRNKRFAAGGVPMVHGSSVPWMR
jgi:hypothetical protein